MTSAVSSPSLDGAASSPQLLRRINVETVLRFAFDRGAFGATDVIDATGLTRSTVLGICAELTEAGWIAELDDMRTAGGYSKGRPARRYGLNASAGVIMAVDAGQHHAVAMATDLAGRPLGRAENPFAGLEPEHRTEVVRRTIETAAAVAGGNLPLLCVVGIPAPVDSAGESPVGTGFWQQMNAGMAGKLEAYGRVVVENDANLAALAEQARGAGLGSESFAVLLSGERFGAGIIIDGHLLRGRHGGAGELRLLELVERVGTADGFGLLARTWAQDLAASGELPAGSALAAVPARELTAEDVFAAARQGDGAARQIILRLGDRLARVSEVLVSLLDVERVIVAGAIADAVGPLIDQATETLAKSFYPPLPTLAASQLGGDVVVLGAVERGLALLRADPLGFRPRA